MMIMMIMIMIMIMMIIMIDKIDSDRLIQLIQFDRQQSLWRISKSQRLTLTADSRQTAVSIFSDVFVMIYVKLKATIID
jgi:hypothetical protein